MIDFQKMGAMTWIKVGLVAMMLMCLLPMPFGFYNLVRFAAMIGFAVLAYDANSEGHKGLTVAYAALALMFQPFFKLALGRDVWNMVDVAVAVFLVVVMLRNKELQ